jgi:hypothetical protein
MAPTTEVQEEKRTRAEALLATHRQKMDELFSGKKYEIVKEVHLNEGQHFQTPFGNKGRHGFALREVSDHKNHFTVGASVLRKAAEEYGAVELPTAPPRKRRTKEQKAADDARLAAERAAS